MSGNSVGAEIVSIAAFGPLVVIVSYLVFRPPAFVQQLLAASAAINVIATLVCAALVAYGCRRVVQSLLRLCGFR